MSGTNKSIDGSNCSTTPGVGLNWRVAAFVAIIIGGLLLLAWVKRTAWRQVDALQAELAAIQTESFYLGVRLRGGVGRLNGRLLRLQLSQDAAERDSFRKESRDLSQWIAGARPFLTTPEERELTAQIERAYDTYLADTAPLLERGNRPVRRDTAQTLYQEIMGKSEALLELCDRLAVAQQIAWQRFLNSSQATLATFERRQHWSLLLMSVVMLSTVALVYRALVSPLRAKLTRTEEMVERQEKLASLGTLATGVAHEIRNPLTAIKFRLFSLQKSLPPETADGEDIQMINGEINRLERIVKDFLQFARPSEPEVRKVSALEILNDVHGLLQPQLARREVDLRLDPTDGVWLRADKQQIQQVLINLVQNAAESIEGRGVITLSATQGAASGTNAAKPMVVLDVADTGHGIAPDVERRLFDPFYSTKEAGTGLGLPIAARIVEKHGGHLQYQTQINRGTTFSVVLPRWTDDASHTPAH